MLAYIFRSLPQMNAHLDYDGLGSKCRPLLLLRLANLCLDRLGQSRNAIDACRIIPGIYIPAGMGFSGH